MTSPLTIAVHFDLICPWCLIGKRHLAKALDQFRRIQPEIIPQVVWHSHPLLPDIPAAGVPYGKFYVKRLGSEAAVAARRVQVRKAGFLADVDFDFDAIRVMPNTLIAHRLVQGVQRHGLPGQAEELIEKLFVAYFMAGQDIGDPAVLGKLAGDCGIEAQGGLVDPDESGGQDLGLRSGRDDVSGVPFYVFNDRITLSGAYPAAALLEAMEDAVR